MSLRFQLLTWKFYLRLLLACLLGSMISIPSEASFKNRGSTIRQNRSTFCADDLANITIAVLKSPITLISQGITQPSNEVNGPRAFGLKEGFFQGSGTGIIGKHTRFTPFEGIRNLVLDWPLYQITKRIFYKPKVTGPVIRWPYKFIAGGIIFSAALFPFQYGINKVGEQNQYHRVHVAQRDLFDDIAKNDVRFRDVKSGYFKAQTEEDANTLKKFKDEAERQREESQILIRSLSDFFKDYNLVYHDSLESKGLKYELFLGLVPQELLLFGINETPGRKLGPQRVAKGPFLNEEEIIAYATIEAELAIALQAAYELARPNGIKIVNKEWKNISGKLQVKKDFLRSTEFYKSLDNLRHAGKIADDAFLTYLQQKIEWEAQFEKADLLGLTFMKAYSDGTGRVSWSNDPLTLAEVERKLLDF